MLKNSERTKGSREHHSLTKITYKLSFHVTLPGGTRAYGPEQAGCLSPPLPAITALAALSSAAKWRESRSACPTLCDPRDYTVHAFLQARVLEWEAFPSPGHLPSPGMQPRSHTLQWTLHQLSQGSPGILEWVACPSSSRSSWPRNRTGVPCIAGGFFTNWATRQQETRKSKSHKDSKRRNKIVFCRRQHNVVCSKS